VSPVIATLLLIAIAVAAGILVYVFVNGLSSNLTQTGGNQVTEHIVPDAYSFTAAGNLTIYLHNVGTGPSALQSFYLNGNQLTEAASGRSGSCHSQSNVVGAHTTCFVSFTISSPTLGATYTIKVTTSDGASSSISVIAGRSS